MVGIPRITIGWVTVGRVMVGRATVGRATVGRATVRSHGCKNELSRVLNVLFFQAINYFTKLV